MGYRRDQVGAGLCYVGFLFDWVEHAASGTVVYVRGFLVWDLVKSPGFCVTLGGVP